ncbi:MAG TPA: hypothetical protein VLK34_03145 [Nocardioidaceae bacterium]|nr:hypothetical protein [Nocardioidaceae bacterium]
MTVLVAWDDVGGADGLVRLLVAELTGRDPGPVHHVCPRCGSVEHGAPYVDAEVAVSIAHATGLSAVAVSAAGPVGIDIERDIERDGESMRDWVRAEAVGKAHQTGIVVEHPMDAPGLWIEDLELPNTGGAIGAVAVLSGERPEVRAAPRRAARP